MSWLRKHTGKAPLSLSVPQSRGFGFEVVGMCSRLYITVFAAAWCRGMDDVDCEDSAC